MALPEFSGAARPSDDGGEAGPSDGTEATPGRESSDRDAGPVGEAQPGAQLRPGSGMAPAGKTRRAGRPAPRFPPATRRRVLAGVTVVTALALVVPLVSSLGEQPAGRADERGLSGRVEAAAQPLTSPPVPASSGPTGRGSSPAEPTSATPSGGSPPASARPTAQPVTAAKSTAPGSRPARPTADPVVRFRAVAGETCAHDDRVTGYYWIGQYSDGQRGWYYTSGGWSGDGCGGRAFAVPMSGYASRDDAEAYVVWWFHTAPVTTGRCEVDVFVPRGSAPRDVAGRPTTYLVLRGKDDYRQVGSFTIDQTAHRNRWASGGSFPVTGSGISIKMVNRGVDAGGEHHGAGQVRVRCAASS